MDASRWKLGTCSPCTALKFWIKIAVFATPLLEFHFTGSTVSYWKEEEKYRPQIHPCYTEGFSFWVSLSNCTRQRVNHPKDCLPVDSGIGLPTIMIGRMISSLCSFWCGEFLGFNPWRLSSNSIFEHFNHKLEANGIQPFSDKSKHISIYSLHLVWQIVSH